MLVLLQLFLANSLLINSQTKIFENESIEQNKFIKEFRYVWHRRRHRNNNFYDIKFNFPKIFYFYKLNFYSFMYFYNFCKNICMLQIL